MNSGSLFITQSSGCPVSIGTVHLHAADKDDSKGSEKVPKRHQERFFDFGAGEITPVKGMRNTGLSSEEIKLFNVEKEKIEKQSKGCPTKNYQSWFSTETLEQLKKIRAFDGKNKPSTIWKQVEFGKLIATLRSKNNQMPDESINAPNKASDSLESKKRKLDVSESEMLRDIARSNMGAVARVRDEPELLKLAQEALAPIVDMKEEEIMKFLENLSLPGKTDYVSNFFKSMCVNLSACCSLGDITASWARNYLIQEILDYPDGNDRLEI